MAGQRTYYIAVDGGGSKTEFCAIDRDTGIARHFLFGSSNYKILETDQEKETILSGFQHIYEALQIEPAQVRGLVMGMSGCDSPEDHSHYLDIALASRIARDAIHICNDSELAFYAKGKPPGLCAVAGTGSVATGVASNGDTARSGGWGTPISDEGSGAWIGIQALREVLRFCDGYGRDEPIYQDIREHFGAASFDALPKILSQKSLTEIAGVARLIMDKADAGEAYCLSLIEEAAAHVSMIAHSVYDKLSFKEEKSVDVVMAGSLFKCGAFRRTFERLFLPTVSIPNMRFLSDVESPVLGGIALARLLFG